MPQEIKILACTHPEIKIFYCPKITNFSTKKFLPLFHCQLKFFCLLHMIAHSYPYNPSRNKNFSMHTPREINFLLSQSHQKFSLVINLFTFSYCQNSKKFISRLHCQIKIPFLLHMIASTFPHHSLTNAIFLSCCCTVLGAKR